MCKPISYVSIASVPLLAAAPAFAGTAAPVPSLGPTGLAALGVVVGVLAFTALKRRR